MKKQIMSLCWATLLCAGWVAASGAQETRLLAEPVINYFNVAPAGILANENQAVILTWSVSGATSITVNYTPCTPSGDCAVGDGQAIATYIENPTVTTTYTLTATNSSGTVSSSGTVTVGAYNNKPPAVPAGLTVTWGAACWEKVGKEVYQAIEFSDSIPSPPGQLPIEATLYFGSTTCDGEYGADNLNDTQGTIGSGGWIWWFIHHPNDFDSSAIWTLGNQSSGCVSYHKAPLCE